MKTTTEKINQINRLITLTLNNNNVINAKRWYRLHKIMSELKNK